MSFDLLFTTYNFYLQRKSLG